MESACRFYENQITDVHRAFLRERYGLLPWFAERMRLGYAPASGSALLLHLLDRGYSRDEVLGSGLISKWEQDKGESAGVADLLRGRLIFPYLDEAQHPVYLIGRATPETPGENPAKYKKQVVSTDGPQEPIFGAWSVCPGEPLIVTEGIADALAVLQDAWSCISPVTTRFKVERVGEAAAWCKRAAAPVYIINDNEASGAGLQGAAKTAVALQMQGIPKVYVGTILRPDGVEKIDLNDYLREGGNLDTILEAATPANDHPAVQEEIKKQQEAGMSRLRAALANQRMQQQSGGKQVSGDSIEDLKGRMPSLSAYTGIAPGHRGAHPVYGSTTGTNFVISPDGGTWTSFHGGNDRGKSGNIFKLIALEQGYLDDEGYPLRGDAFKRTIEYCRDRWG